MPVLKINSSNALNSGSSLPIGFVRCLCILALVSTIVAWDIAHVSAAEADAGNIRSSAVWRYCEEYFVKVEGYKNKSRHFEIEDISHEFLETAKSLRPQNKEEAYLLNECLNLANGNAYHAFQQIQKEETGDDKFFKQALTKAQNDSAASEYKYMSKIDGKYDFAMDTAAAKEEYKNRLVQARVQALRASMQNFNAIGLVFQNQMPTYIDGLGYNYSSYLSYGDQRVIGSFNIIVNTANMLLALGTIPASGSGSSVSSPNYTLAPTTGGTAHAKAGTFTSAPIGSTPKAKPSAPKSVVMVAPTKAPSNAEEVVQDESTSNPEKAVGASGKSAMDEDESLIAAKADSECVSYSVEGSDILFAVVQNKCDFPLQWHWCWLSKDKKSCEPDSLSGIIEPGQSKKVDGPLAGQQHQAKYIVCDMSDPDKLCSF